MILSELHRIQTIELKAHLLFHFALQFSMIRSRKLPPRKPLSGQPAWYRPFCRLKKRFRFSQSARYVYAPLRSRCQELFFIFLIFFQKAHSTTEQRSALMPLIPALVNLNLQFLINYFNFNF